MVEGIEAWAENDSLRTKVYHLHTYCVEGHNQMLIEP